MRAKKVVVRAVNRPMLPPSTGAACGQAQRSRRTAASCARLTACRARIVPDRAAGARRDTDAGSGLPARRHRPSRSTSPGDARVCGLAGERGRGPAVGDAVTDARGLNARGAAGARDLLRADISSKTARDANVPVSRFVEAARALASLGYTDVAPSPHAPTIEISTASRSGILPW